MRVDYDTLMSAGSVATIRPIHTSLPYRHRPMPASGVRSHAFSARCRHVAATPPAPAMPSYAYCLRDEEAKMEHYHAAHAASRLFYVASHDIIP